MNNLNLATIAIVVANIIVSFKGFEDSHFFERYKFGVGPIKAGQKERIVYLGFFTCRRWASFNEYAYTIFFCKCGDFLFWIK